MSQRYKQAAAVVLLLQRGNEFLLERRGPGSKVFLGYYSLPGGMIDEGETALQACVREAREELGITLAQQDVQLVHVLHRGRLEGVPADFILFVFRANKWQNEPCIAEADKATWVGWCNPNTVVDKMIPHLWSVFEQIDQGAVYSEFGW